jgi:hypothetical protein
MIDVSVNLPVHRRSNAQPGLPRCVLSDLPAKARRLACVLAAVILSAAAMAQSPGGGTIAGHVRGPRGVSVPGATVDLIESQTGERKETWTDETGNYILTGVTPGSYTLEVSLLGFREDVREPVPVTAGQQLRVNISLLINVPENSGLASRPGGPASGSMPNGKLLPRNPSSLPPGARERLRQLATQGAISGGPPVDRGGVEQPQGAANLRFSDNAASAEPTQNGGSPPGSESDAGGGPGGAEASASNSFLLSGSVGQAATPGGDEQQMRQRIQEFRQSQQGAPGFGGGGGGGFGDAVMFMGGRFGGRRPRVNRLRGNFVERYSDSSLDARPYPLNVAESPQIASYQQQLGASIGGPLVIPKIYHGRDKTSFFVNYNLQRNRNPFNSYGTVPTASERLGDFSKTVIPSGPFAGTIPVIFEPNSNPRAPRTPFPGNQIPASDFSPAAAGLLQFIPLPNLPGSVQNFHLHEALPSNNDRLMVRIGHQISNQDSVSVFYFINSTRSESVSSFPELTTNNSTRGQNLNLSENHTYSPQMVNNVAVNFNRQRISILNPFAFQQDISGGLGIRGISQNPRDWGLPAVAFTNFAALTDTIPALTRNQTWRVFDFVILNKSKHTFRLGGELRRVQVNTLTDPDARGTFTFSGFTTSNFGPSGQPVPGTGFDFADFLLGLPQATAVRFGTSSNYFRSWVYSGFLQDDWRIGPRLTLDLGVRYEYFTPFTEKYGHLSDLNIGPAFAVRGVVTGQSPGPFPPSLVRGDKNNLAPRLGLAFRPWTTRHWVLRAGYGIFYDGSIYQRLAPNLANQPPFAQASTLLTSPMQVLTLENGFPQIAAGVARNTYAVDPNFRTPYGQTWNFGVEDEIASNWVLSVNYVGTKGTKLDLLLGPNPANSRAGGQRALQYIYETSGATSIYQGLQISLRRQFRGGLSTVARYTFSKSIDDAASVGGAGSLVAQNFLDLAAERGLSVFDRRHQFLLNYNYEFPFGERKHFLNKGGGLARVLGGWQMSGVSTIESGTPYTARLLGNVGNNARTGAYFSERAQATGLPVSLVGSDRTGSRYFNTAAFTLPPPGQLGNAGRNTIPGPPTINFNTSLDREIVFSQEKGVRADFRLEANNVFNTPNFSGLATVVNAADFGRITSVQNMRTLAFSVRIRF